MMRDEEMSAYKLKMRKEYEAEGYELNNGRSQAAHLAQAKLVYSLCTGPLLCSALASTPTPTLYLSQRERERASERARARANERAREREREREKASKRERARKRARERASERERERDNSLETLGRE
jgi:hypothetical protein